MITKFKIFEGIRWWRDGKLGDEEEEDNFQQEKSNDIQVGDWVKMRNRIDCRYVPIIGDFHNSDYMNGEELGKVGLIKIIHSYKCCLIIGKSWYKMDCLEKIKII